MIMIHCHLHKLVEFVKNRLIHSSNDSSTQEIITRAVQVFYDQSVSELIVNNGYLYYAKYSRSVFSDVIYHAGRCNCA